MHAFLKSANPNLAPPLKERGKEAKQKPKREVHVPWVEKYRPKTVDDVAHQDEVVSVLKKSLLGADLPNLLFYGPPGTGKTSTILALSRELFGDMYKSRILELNASDERGIQVVREKIKNFSQLTANATRPDGRPCPPFKIVILDEADSMTPSAQAALRRTMEKQTKTTRFCLICNYISRIIEPLTSRCSKFRFKPLPKDILLERLQKICTAENVQCDDEAILFFFFLKSACLGDMRRAITLFQSVSRLKLGEPVLTEDVAEVACIIPKSWVDRVLQTCASNSYEKLDQTIQDLVLEGYPASQLFNQLHDVLIASADYDDKQKSVIMEKLAICDHRLLEGADEYLQMMDLCVTIMNQVCSVQRA
ncbi:replication factor C, subunit RFC4, putative [Ixodes scapularis]|uniref:Replication factor C subunit 4 n=1 Tax=Ixodes scapularis TaxID=6945 RepID=B7QHT5_IXOSC|nr:replication factor C, subunit RFC4, putative [Ixodes scapularis]|eukprot:XP_002414742.1 replication factor C, subunit RFC4, putative [Ixodes scapularis]